MNNILLLEAANRGSVKYSSGTWSNSNCAKVLNFELLQEWYNHFDGDFVHHWESFYGNITGEADDE